MNNILELRKKSRIINILTLLIKTVLLTGKIHFTGNALPRDTHAINGKKALSQGTVLKSETRKVPGFRKAFTREVSRLDTVLNRSGRA